MSTQTPTLRQAQASALAVILEPLKLLNDRDLPKGKAMSIACYRAVYSARQGVLGDPSAPQFQSIVGFMNGLILALDFAPSEGRVSEEIVLKETVVLARDILLTESLVYVQAQQERLGDLVSEFTRAVGQ